ncbi:CHASE domain-containing protein, partial [Klebsiella pneumoniae]|uniref:CHASE domain-containing protein n=1 Tax=Klebsiella pneumoniae TaxID=573 RepID=UPI003EE0D0A1
CYHSIPVLAPDGVIRHIAPLEGNEKALGLDLLNYPAQRTEASISRSTGQLTLAGPLELIQGGQALAGRL